MMLLSTVMLVSCLSDNDSSGVYYSDTAITAVTLGTLNRYTGAISSSTGNDTIVKTTLTGSNYKLTIDQLGRKIFNRDSLPLGTDLKHVTISTLSTKNSGVVFIKSLISDTLFYISTTDSLDFSEPRTLRVVSSDGLEHRDYTMTISASTTRGTTFGWQLVRKADELAGWTDKKLVPLKDSVVLVGQGTISMDNPYLGGSSLVRLGSDGYIEWTHTPETYDSWVKMLDAEGNRPPIKQLIGATRNEMFAIGTDGRLKVCYDCSGLSWHDESLDESETLLPTSAIAMTNWKYAPADSTDYVLLAGNSSADDVKATLWRKLSRYHALLSPTEGTWVYMPVDGNNRFALPRQEYLSMVYYNNNVLAVGSNMILYQSRDQGITWKSGSIYALPSQIEGTRATIAADSRDRLWLVTDTGQLWMGKLR